MDRTDTTAWTAATETAGTRLDQFLARTANEPRARIQQLIEQGCVSVNGRERPKNYRLHPGDRIELVRPEPAPPAAAAQEIPLAVVYEDADLLVVNKPRGMVVHPAPGHADGTLVNALIAHCGDSLSGIGGVQRPGIVHRIDKDTSGLLIVAKNDLAHRGLAAQIKEHSFSRVYEAVVIGHPDETAGTVDAPVGRHPVHRKKMAVFAAGPNPSGGRERNGQSGRKSSVAAREAVTHYETLAEYRGYSHLRLRLETGRTHQIRVHMAYLGHPVAGDPLYGGGKLPPGGQCLHAREIGFAHPRTGEPVALTSSLPEYFTAFLARIGGA